MKLINDLVFAISFLTIIPLGKIQHKVYNSTAASVIYFPLVGLLIGFFLYMISILAGHLINPLLLAIIIVLTEIWITGGLHMDGVADTFDGFYGGKTPESVLTIMRDSNTGAMGVLAVLSVILLKIGLIYSLASEIRPIVLLLMPVTGRWAMVIAIFSFKYARQVGKASNFYENKKVWMLVLSTLLFLVVTALILKTTSIYAALIVFIITFLIGIYSKSKVKGITGDVLGLINEINEIVFIIIAFLGLLHVV